MSDKPDEFQQLKAINWNENLACNLITESGANTVDCVVSCQVSQMEWICQTYVLASGASQSAWNGQKFDKSAPINDNYVF